MPKPTEVTTYPPETAPYEELIMYWADCDEVLMTGHRMLSEEWVEDVWPGQSPKMFKTSEIKGWCPKIKPIFPGES